jgi:N,N-dimethylformamidase
VRGALQQSMTRRRLLTVGGSALVCLVGPAGRGLAAVRLLGGLRIGNGGHPFARDGPKLTTLGPTRPAARLNFMLLRRSRVRLEVLQTGQGAASKQPVPDAQPPRGERAVTLEAGRHQLRWTPPADLPPRTYILRLTARHRAVKEGASAVARVLGVDAAFARRSAQPGETVPLVVATDARRLTLQMLRSGPEAAATSSNDEIKGLPVSDSIEVDWERQANGAAPISVGVGTGWPSGVYAARLDADDGRVGFAPLIVRPGKPAARVAVVMPTSTWAAYNFYDADGDGWGDTWYARWATRHVDLTRPNAHRGVPHRYRSYDLAFQHWLAQTGTVVDSYADEDIEAFTPQDLRAAYDLVVFPGHTEYVTAHLYTTIESYRDLGGNLLFLSADNFYRRVDRRHHVLTLVGEWRKLGRPESALCGVQYVGNDRGSWRRPFTVVGADVAPWAFSGTGLGNGSTFGIYGVEFDGRAADSPPGTLVLANIPNVFGGGRTAEMTYYEHPSGARVFSAGALDFGGKILLWPQVRTLFENVWQRLT